MTMFVVEQHNVRVDGVDVGRAGAGCVRAAPARAPVGEHALLHERKLPAADDRLLLAGPPPEPELRPRSGTYTIQFYQVNQIPNS